MANSYDKNWDAYAALIDERKESKEWAVLRRAREGHWDEHFDVKEGDAVLDAGCGHGDYTVLALKQGCRVWAFDYSAEMTRSTEARIERSGLRAELVSKESVTSIPYPDAMFDSVFCLAVLDHLSDEDRAKALKELRRVLKKNGTLYLDVPNRLAYHWRCAFMLMRWLKMYPKGSIRFFTPWGLKRLLRSHGFVDGESIGLTICPPFSGIYTTDIRRLTFLPEGLIKILDRIYLFIETSARRVSFLKPLCWHYFLKSKKSAAC